MEPRRTSTNPSSSGKNQDPRVRSNNNSSSSSLPEYVRQPSVLVRDRALELYRSGLLNEYQLGLVVSILGSSRHPTPAQGAALDDVEAAVKLLKAAQRPRKTLAEACGYWSRQAMLERRAEWERLRDDGWPQAEAEIAKLDARLGEDK